MEPKNIKIGIIGGTGLGDPDILKDRQIVEVDTRFGKPSDGSVITGTIQNVPCVLISRHGRNHDIPPSKVNFRANIWALKDLGCTHIVVTTATGSLKEEIRPGDLIIPDDFIDRTYKRRQTFYDGDEDSFPGVFHLPMHPPFSEPLRRTLIETAQELNINCRTTGTIVTIEGPRFSSRAESKMYQMLGCDLVNMSTVPEVMLAKEAGLLYAAIAVATDYDCWREDCEHVSHTFVQRTFRNNMDKITKLLIAVVEEISKRDWQEHITDLKDTVNNSMM